MGLGQLGLGVDTITLVVLCHEMTKPKKVVNAGCTTRNRYIWFWFCHFITEAPQKQFLTPDTRDTPLCLLHYAQNLPPNFPKTCQRSKEGYGEEK